MKTKTLLTGLLTLAMTVTLTTGAMAQEQFQGTVTLGPNMVGEFVIEDLGVGDEVILTLVNPTNQPLTFSTTEQLGEEASWTVPANSQRTVSFTYNRPFDDDVEFLVMDPGGTRISQGVLFNIDEEGVIDDDLIGEDEGSPFGTELGEDVIRETVTLRSGSGAIRHEDLGAGDTLMLTLVNPTGQDMRFETTNRIGDEQAYIIPANSRRSVAVEYNTLLSDQLEYVAMPTGTVAGQPVQVETEQAVRGYW